MSFSVVRPGNNKTGKATGQVSIMASEKHCPGANECAQYCYAKKGTFKYPSVKKAFARDTALLETDPAAYFKKVRQDIEEAGFMAVRLHVSGDFFSPEQIKGWAQVAKSMPHVRFWGYTKSWKVAALVPDLITLRDLPNVELFASWADGEPIPTKWRLAQVVPKGSKPQAGATLCLEQVGAKPNCASCGFCLRPATNKTQNVNFIIH